MNIYLSPYQTRWLTALMDNQKIRWAYLTEAEVIMVREVLNNGYYSNIEGHELRDIATYYKNKLLLDKSSIRVILKK